MTSHSKTVILHHKQEQNNYLLEENWKAIGFADTLDYASIFKSRNVPISVISKGMGHDFENTT